MLVYASAVERPRHPWGTAQRHTTYFLLFPIGQMYAWFIYADVGQVTEINKRLSAYRQLNPKRLSNPIPNLGQTVPKEASHS